MRVVEMMVVVVISILLGAVAWFNARPLLAKARYAADKHELELLATALTMYETDNGFLPASLAGLTPLYFRTTSGYDKDTRFRSYVYNRTGRTICSVDADCVDF